MVMEPGEPLLPELFSKNRKVTVVPPSEHFGEALADSSPVAVARIGVMFYETVLRDGFAKFVGPTQSPGAR